MEQKRFVQWRSGIRDLTVAQRCMVQGALRVNLAMGGPDTPIGGKDLERWIAGIEDLTAAQSRVACVVLGVRSARAILDAPAKEVGFLQWMVGINNLTAAQCREASALISKDSKGSTSDASAEDARFLRWLSGIGALMDVQRHFICAVMTEYRRNRAPGTEASSDKFVFIPERQPFPYWKGPYSPSRGNTSGFRVRNGRLGACVSDERNFKRVEESDGVLALSRLVQKVWGGGRVLFLPSGHIIKPLQEENERGMRVFIGRYKGGFRFFDNGSCVDFAPGKNFDPGSRWAGPTTIGLECRIYRSGLLTTRWKEPIEYGDQVHHERILGDASLFNGFRKARPGDTGGRVRITVGGHVITNRQEGNVWSCFYVGKIGSQRFLNWDRWIAGEWD